MRLDTESRTIVSQGVTRVRQAGLKLGPHILRTLADQYSDPLWAAPREYIANAYDAHNMRSTPAPKPIQIHLPTSFEPWFEVRDYGVGMDYDTLWERYTVFGESSKQGDNNNIGGFGYGCKTAFAYLEGSPWTAISYFNGRRMGLAAYRNATGMPEFAEICDEPTDEPNGVAVRIPIAPQHFLKVATSVARMRDYAPYPLEIIGAMQERTHKIAKRGKYYIVWTPSGRRGQVVMGGVPYPYEASLQYDLVLPIGAVPVTPSRDNLLYTDASRQTLYSAAKRARDELEADLQTQMRAATNLWDALKLSEQLHNEFSFLNWRPKHYGPQQIPFDYDKGLVVTVAQIEAALGCPAEIIYREEFERGQGPRSELCLHPSNQPHFIVRDVPGHGEVAKLYWKDIDSQHNSRWNRYARRILVIIKPEGEVAPTAYQTLNKLLYNAPITRVSELRAQYGITNQSSRLRKEAAGQFRYSTGGTWAPCEATLPKVGYWVPLSGCVPEDTGCSPAFVKNVLESGYVAADHVFGVPKYLRSKIPNGWVELLPMLRKKVQQDASNLSPVLRARETASIPHYVHKFLVKRCNDFQAPELQELGARLAPLLWPSSLLAKEQIASALGIKIPQDDKPIASLYRECCTRWPLLANISSYGFEGSVNQPHVIRYLNAEEN